MIPITGRTVNVGVMGSPVRHCFRRSRTTPPRGTRYRCAVAVSVVPSSGVAAVDAMRTLGIRGLSVTMPHKEAVLAGVDTRSPVVDALGAANCLVNDDGVITAHNTDGDGFVRSLLVEQGIDLSGRRVALIGAGGAARSVAEAVGRAGVADLAIMNRTPARA